MYWELWGPRKGMSHYTKGSNKLKGGRPSPRKGHPQEKEGLRMVGTAGMCVSDHSWEPGREMKLRVQDEEMRFRRGWGGISKGTQILTCSQLYNLK